MQEGGHGRKWRTGIVQLLFFAVVAGIGYVVFAQGWFSFGPSSRSAAPVSEKVWSVNFAPATVGSHTLSHYVYGKTTARHSSPLSFPIAGCVREVSDSLRPGLSVQKGRKLAVLDTTRIENQILSAQLRRRMLKAENSELVAKLRGARKLRAIYRKSLALGDKTVTRLKRLTDSGSVPVSSLEEAQIVRNEKLIALTNIDNTMAELSSAGVTLKRRIAIASAEEERASIDLKKSVLRAPHDGVVVSSAIQNGTCINDAQPVVEFVDSSLGELVFDVPVFVFQQMTRNGDPIGVSFPFSARDSIHSDEFRATVQRISPKIDSSSHSIKLYAQISDTLSVNTLRVGQTVEARLPISKLVDVFKLPEETVFDDGFVYVIISQRLQKRTVELAGRDASFVYVRGDLKQDDRVLSTPLKLAMPGLQVEVLGASPLSSQ